MTYREAIKNSLDTFDIGEYAEQDTEIQHQPVLPISFPGLLFSMASILMVSAEQLCTQTPSYSLGVGKGSSSFSQKKRGQVSILDILQVFNGNDLMRYGALSVQLNQFFTWLLDKEIPETDENMTLWYDISCVGKAWNEFIVIKQEEKTNE